MTCYADNVHKITPLLQIGFEKSFDFVKRYRVQVVVQIDVIGDRNNHEFLVAEVALSFSTCLLVIFSNIKRILAEIAGCPDISQIVKYSVLSFPFCAKPTDVLCEMPNIYILFYYVLE